MGRWIALYVAFFLVVFTAGLGVRLLLVTGPPAMTGGLAGLVGSASQGPVVPPRPAVEAPEDCALASVERAIDTLEARITRRAFEVELREAQLRSLGGAPVPWPDDPDIYAPAVYERAMEDLASANDEVLPELVAVDCSEYPCLSVWFEAGGRGTNLYLGQAKRHMGYGPRQSSHAVVGFRGALLFQGAFDSEHVSGEAEIMERLRVRKSSLEQALDATGRIY